MLIVFLIFDGEKDVDAKWTIRPAPESESTLEMSKRDRAIGIFDDVVPEG